MDQNTFNQNVFKMDAQMQERFTQLPQSVQNAVTSAEISQHLQKLAEDSFLHVDQWGILENEVMLAVLGIQPVAELENNIATHLRLPRDTAHVLTENIVKEIFEPVRQELEKTVSNTPANTAPQPSALAPAPVAPATPPPPSNETKVERAPLSASYQGQQPSHERKGAEGDPYREQVV